MCCCFQHSWEDGLKAVEAAIGAMPKELYHNLLHYKIIFKSRLGRGVESDMIKFQVQRRDVQYNAGLAVTGQCRVQPKLTSI